MARIKNDEHFDKQAERLRANLKKRKEQIRARKALEDGESEKQKQDDSQKNGS